MISKIFVLGVTIAVGQACGGNRGEGTDQKDPVWEPVPIPNQGPIPPATNLICPNGTVLTYDNFGEAFMLNYCTTCHSSKLTEEYRGGAPSHIDLDTPENVQVWRASIITFATGEGATMPPSRNVPPQDMIKLTEWLSCGAPAGSDNVE